MTTPGGHGSNEINLAALWVPVMPETSKMAPEMRKAGEESKRQFEQGFNTGSSPEAMGQSFVGKFTQTIGQGLQGFELPLGMSKAIDKFGTEVDTKLINKLKGEASDALSKYRQEYENLTAAENRAAEAEQKVATARSNGFNNASVMLPLMQQQTKAQNELEAAHKSTGVALEDYNTKVTKLGDAMPRAAAGGEMLAGVMGGLVVAAAQQLTGAIDAVAEKIIEGAVEAFKMGIEGAKEFAEKMLELGETYEQVEHQVVEFSGGTSAQLEELSTHAQRVFSTLDVAGNNTGKTMAQFASMLNMEPGPALDALTKHVVELQGRFSDLKGDDLASIFVAFKTPAEETDSALASLLQSARNSGQDLGQLTSALSGDAAITLKEAGLNLQQAGAFMGELMKMGAPGRSVMMGLQAAMKDFASEGLSFGDGMKMAGQRLKELGDTAAGQDLAEKLFGTRRWAVAMQAVQQYVDVVAKGPDAYNANAAGLDDFIQRTRTLQNEWEEVKHKVEAAFLPMGLAAVHLASTGLDALTHYVSDHMDTIKKTVMIAGVEIIKFAADLQKFGQGLLEFFAPIADAISTVLYGAIEGLAGFGKAAGGLMEHIPGLRDIGHGLSDASDAAGKMGDQLKNLNVGDKMRDLADWSKQHPIDVDKASQSWLNFASHVDDAMNSADSSVHKSDSWFGNAGSSMPGVSGPMGFPPVGSSGQFPSPGGTLGSGLGAPATAGPPPAGPGQHHADWDAIAQKESGGRWNETFNTGVPLGGGLQIKPETWYEFGGLAFSQYAYQATKEQQEAIAERILNGWGSNPGQGPKAWDNGNTYVEKKVRGGAPGRPITQGSGKDDDVAALLKRGEYVWDTDTVDKYGWLIKALHSGSVYGFDQGGGLDTQGAQVDTIAVARAAQALFGVNDIGMYRSPDGYNEHASGEAADVMVGNNKALGDAVAQYFLQHAAQFGVQYVLWQQAQWNPDGTSSKMSDRGGATANHLDHVHVRTLGGGFPQGQKPQGFAAPSTGQTSNEPSAIAQYSMGGGGTLPGGSNGAYYPGMEGQYGGAGVYGGETYDQQVQAQQNIQAARDRAADLDWTVKQAQDRIADINKQLANIGGDRKTKTGALGLPVKEDPATAAQNAKADADKRDSLQRQLDDANHSLEVAKRDRSEQDGKITEAERKAQEATYKKPSAATTSAAKAFPGAEQLGAGLLQGIGQELGFGDLFAKPPWEWGAVKLLTGAAGWALGTANAWSDAIMGGGSGSSGVNTSNVGGGMLSGLASGLGINLPKANVSAGANISPGTGMPQPYGALGPAPGPVVQGDYQPIYVSPNVDPNAILGPVKEQQNSQNAQLHGQTGGLP
jgi:hypothetical protein